jgi:hypothetical protein
VRTRIKVIECGHGHWDEQDHGLDTPHGTDTIDFRVTGTGHDRIERMYQEGCVNCRRIIGFNDKHRIADWLCRNACSFVLFDTKDGATIIGFEREDDAEAFRREFVVTNR